MSMYDIACGLNTDLVIAASVVLGFNIQEKFPHFWNVFDDIRDAPFKADLYVYTRMPIAMCDGPSSQGHECVLSKSLKDEDWCVGIYRDPFDKDYLVFGVRFTKDQRDLWGRILSGEMEYKQFISIVTTVFSKTAICSQ